jgi:hypothetical protein
MVKSVYPMYVEHGGELSYPAPVVCEGTNLYGFILEGNPDNLTAFCRRVFYEPSGGQVDYIPLSHYVMLTIGRIRKIYSSSMNIGWSPETQTIFWVLTAAGHQVGSVFFAERLALLPAYVVVHDMYSLISGREVYGFFKSYGWIDVPDSDEVVSPEQLKLDVYGLKDFNPNHEAQRWPLLEVSRIGAAKGGTGTPWNTLEDAFHEIKSTMQSSSKDIILPGLSLSPTLISDLLHKEVPVAFLKQFRDAGNQGGAAYQAVLEAPAAIQRFTGFTLIDDYQVSIVNNLASYPLAADLGIASQKSILSFKLDMDFTFEEGREIWKAGAPTGLLGFLARLFGQR